MPYLTVRIMTLSEKVLILAVVALGARVGLRPAEAAPAQTGGDSAQIASRLARALESGHPAALASLFPADRKIRVSLEKIADLKGFVGAGPLVEALSRYLSSKDSVRFDPDPDASGNDASAPVRVRGVLTVRDRSGKKERIALVFLFESIGPARLAVEVRETG